jgi:hypothetical protein
VNVRGFNIVTVGALIMAAIGLGWQWRTIKALREPDDRGLPTVSANVQEQPDTVRQAPSPQERGTASELAKLREQNTELSTRVKQLQAQIALAEPFTPGLEKPEAAYFGPGKWVKAEKTSFFEEATVSGSGNNMTIRVVGGGGAEWPDLALQPVYFPTINPDSVYRRGLAQWDEALDEIQQLLVTFEKDGLRIDWLRVPKSGHEARCRLFVSRLKQVRDN